MTSSLQSLIHKKNTATPHLVLKVESGSPFFKNYFDSLSDKQFVRPNFNCQELETLRTMALESDFFISIFK